MRRRKNSYRALMGAALALPGLGIGHKAAAQTAPDPAEMRLEYSYYKDYQSGHEDRMEVHAPQIWLTTPIGERTSVEGSFTYDSMSGASPYYYSSLSSASSREIKDNRRAGDIKLSHYFDRFSIGAGGVFSTEDDYDSSGGLLESRIWTPTKNTVFALGVSANHDNISSSNNPDLHESRNVQGYIIGVTQILNPRSILQSNLTYQHGRGYHADPYKTFDNRPEVREQWAWLSRHNQHFPELRGSLHSEYRLYRDSWGVTSHTIEFAWYQELDAGWMVRPNIRYYSQRGADFFAKEYPPQDFESFYSADQRVGDFGSVTTGLQLRKELGDGYSVDLTFQFLVQKENLKLGSSRQTEIEDFYARWLTLGVNKKF